jgi:hypothetical protein
MSGAFPPKITLCRLYEKVSSRGSQYFQGRLSAARIILLKSREVSESGEPIWELCLQELSQPAARTAPQAPDRDQLRFSRRRENVQSGRGFLHPDRSTGNVPDDAIHDLWNDREQS